MTTEENNMFWNRKKRKQEKEMKAMDEVRSAPEPDISEPIKAFLSASGRWELDSGLDVECHVKSWRIATDPETGLSLRIDRWEGIARHYSCVNHSWVTFDEAVAVWDESGRVFKEREEDQDRKIRQKWTEAYKNRGEVE